MLVYSFHCDTMSNDEKIIAIEEAYQDCIEARDDFARIGASRLAKEMDDFATGCLASLAKLKEEAP